MSYLVAANAIVILHLSFVCFVMVGGLLVLRWHRLALIHLPCVIWGALIEFQSWFCPLTLLEQELREAGSQAGYGNGFVEHYIVPVLYPDFLSRDIQVIFGSLVVIINVAIYGWIVYRRMKNQ